MSKSTLTRRNLVAGAAAVPAFALPAVAGTAATPSPDELAALDRAAIVARAEQMVEVLRTCHVVDGWQLDEPRAAHFLDSLRRLDFNDGDTAEMTAVLDWVQDHGQSLDWIFCGDPVRMVCRGAAQSPRAPTPDAELLRLGLEVEKFGQEWLAQIEVDKQNSKEYRARCEAAGLPDVEFNSMPLAGC